MGAELEGQSRRDRVEEEVGALQVGLGVVEVVRVVKEKRGEAEARTDLSHGEEGGAALQQGLEALHGARIVAGAFRFLGEAPEALGNGIHGHH